MWRNKMSEKTLTRNGMISLLVSGLLGLSQAHAGPSPYATTVIINGKVIAADSDDIKKIGFYEAIAIQDNEIMAVGSNAEIKKYVADWTETIDAKGNTVLPGLIDTHNHLYENTLQAFPWVLNTIPELLQIDLSAKSEEEMIDLALKASVARSKQIPAGQWIQVNLAPARIAVNVIGKKITKKILDEQIPNHPIFMSTRGGAVYNTAGIKSIEARFRNPIPDDFWIDKVAGWSGDYTDGPRCIRGDVIVADAHRENEYTKGYLEVMQLNAQTGLTTHSTHIQCENGFNASVHLDRNHLMPIRLSWGHRWMQPFNPRITETYWRIGDWTGYGSNMMWSNGSSAGAFDGGGVAWCTSIPAKTPELKKRELCPTPESSTANMRRLEHYKVLVELAAAGRQTGIPGWHMAGDGALKFFQDELMKSGMSLKKLHSLRLQTDHCHSVTQDQIKLAARIGQTFSCDATEVPSEVLKADYGDEYLTLNAPMGSMLKAGIHALISEFGSQGEIRYSPFEDGVAWMTRKINGDDFGVPEEAVPDRLTLLLMMTRWGAYQVWKENNIGSIEPGKWADIIILNGNYMDVAVEDLDTLRPIMTMVDGRIVYEDEPLRGNLLRFNTDPDKAKWEIKKSTPTSLWRWPETGPVIPPRS